ncbi:RHS repeat domain-containing protein [Arenimonas fontis]|uniref:RHS repeat-associated core domain-containing protein n=1 Tax=Arenimonas fontis TaxID=2608255 RepID=A0A5B2ZER6_9GAMM|nr:RHS repeat-associated core domain-containing protein [Arenimonas fontis]KAA2285531.1 RHS repeat-associated core domain-containing protein [Arenimonas fontis]
MRDGRLFVAMPALALLAALIAGPVAAQAKFKWEEHSALVKARQVVGALGPDFAGDDVGLYNGSLRFSATDVELPGNAALTVAIRRSFAVSEHRTQALAFGDWDIELPRVHGVFARQTGWVNASGSPSRCAVGSVAAAQPPAVTLGSNFFLPEQYWQGHQVDLPGRGSQELLLTAAGSQRPAGGPWYWVTNDWTYFGCLASVRNGSGQGFLAITADGTRYWFDWMASNGVEGLRAKVNQVEARSGDVILYRDRVSLYATRVEDRFGNWVTYSYANAADQPVRLTAVEASDGRRITLGYDGQGRVASVTAHGRSWSYQYGPGGSLTQVGLPDGSRWTIDFAALSSAGIRYVTQEPGEPWRDCFNPPDVLSGEAVGRITHPSGATAEFTVAPRRFGRSNVPYVCENVTGPYNDPNDDLPAYPVQFYALALLRKRVTGPGLAAAEWNYDYGGVFGFAPVQGHSFTEVRGPEGTYVRYTFGNRYRDNEGLLLRVERGTGPTGILESRDDEYQISGSGQPFPPMLGQSPQPRGDSFTAEALRPLKSSVTRRQGTDFSYLVTQYDAFGRPVSVIRASSLGTSRTERTEYFHHLGAWVLGQVARVTVTDTEPDVVLAEVEYDPTTALPLRFYAPGTTTTRGPLEQSLSYHADGTVWTVTDGRGQATTLTDWKRGIPQTIGQADGTVVKAGVNDQGWIVWREDERGSRTCYGYDGMGRVSGVTWPSGSQAGVCDASAWAPTGYAYVQVASSEYGLPAGHWRVVESRGSYRKATYYDGLWRPVIEREYDAADPGGTQRFRGWRHDAYGRVVFEGYPRASASGIASFGQGVGTAYDALGRVTRVSQDSELGPLVTTTAYLSGYKTRVTNPRGYSTLTEYLAWDQPSTAWPVKIVQAEGQPEQQSTQIARNAFGHPTRLTRSGMYDGSAQSVVRQYVYDAQQRLCKRIEPETGATLFAYDAAGNLAWSAEGTGLSTLSCDRGSVAAADKVLRRYDARNRLILVDYPDDTPDVSTTYHPDGAVHQVVSGQVTLTYGYNRLGRLTSERLQYGSLDWLTQYGYTALGHLATLTYRDGHQVNYAPNALGQPTQAGTYATGVTYHPNGAIKQFTYGNGLVHTLSQNIRGLPERSRDALGSTVILDDSYDYDHNGNVAAISDGLPGQPGNRDMRYDALDRLLGVTAGSAQGGNGSFAYDALDNLRRLAQGSRDYRLAYDAANRNHQVKDAAGAGVFSQSYDARGRLVQRQWVGGPTDTFSFDLAHRLTASTVGGLSSTYVYDGLGRRVREVQGASTYFQYGQDGRLLYTNDLKTQFRHNHIYLGGTLVATRTVSFDGAVRYVRYQHTDALGSPVAETDEAGQGVGRERLTAWGEPADGTWRNGPGFTGHRMDAATRLVYMQQRYYDPVIGRFLSVDPVAADMTTGWNSNRYNYAANNPYANRDPDGRACDSLSGSGCGMSASGQSTSDPAAARAAAGLVVDFIPVVGDAKAVFEAIQDPSAVNIAAAGVGLVPVFGDAAGKAIKAGSNIAENAAKGARAEDAVATSLGDSVAGRRVTLEASTGQRSVADIVTTDRGVVEVKSGGGRLSPGQRAVQADIDAGRPVTPRGQNAANAGLEPGKPTQMKCYDVKRC